MNSERWQKLTLPEQLANIGSEVNRVIYWKSINDQTNTRKAASRTLELLDLTLADPRWRFRLQEICRLREVFCDYYLGPLHYKTSQKILRDYFLPFASLVRNNMIRK